MLGQLNEKKSLIYFAGGLRLNGVDNEAQLQATVDAAIRAGVSFWPIDARGLVASAPLGDATKGSPGSQAMYNGQSAQAFTNNFQQSQDTLYALGGDTGGKLLRISLDLSTLFDTRDEPGDILAPLPGVNAPLTPSTGAAGTAGATPRTRTSS